MQAHWLTVNDSKRSPVKSQVGEWCSHSESK